MKIFILATFLLASLHGNEMQRIENIVKDISKLRVDYEECSTKLKAKNSTAVPFTVVQENSDDLIKKYEMSIKDEREKNSILLKESKSFAQENSELTKKIQELEKLVKKQDTLLKIKEKSSTPLKKESVVIVPKKVVCEEKEENSFPDLMMKEKFAKKSISKEMPQEIEAASYKLNVTASVYDMIDGKEISKWEEGKSFTSNIQSQNWIKITGYFLDKKWLPSQKEMWMKLEKVEKK